MKVKIIRSTFINGDLAQVNDVVEVSDADGKQLIATKKAIVAADGKVERAVGKAQQDK